MFFGQLTLSKLVYIVMIGDHDHWLHGVRMIDGKESGPAAAGPPVGRSTVGATDWPWELPLITGSTTGTRTTTGSMEMLLHSCAQASASYYKVFLTFLSQPVVWVVKPKEKLGGQQFNHGWIDTCGWEPCLTKPHYVNAFKEELCPSFERLGMMDHCTVDSYLQGPKQVKDRKNGKKKVAWPLSK